MQSLSASLGKISSIGWVGMIATGALLIPLATMKVSAYALSFFGIHIGSSLSALLLKGTFYSHVACTFTTFSAKCFQFLSGNERHDLNSIDYTIITANVLLLSTFVLSKLGPSMLLGIATTQIFHYATLSVMTGCLFLGLTSTCMDAYGIWSEGFKKSALYDSLYHAKYGVLS